MPPTNWSLGFVTVWRPARRVRGQYGPRRWAPSRLRQARKRRRRAATAGADPLGLALAMVFALLAMVLVLAIALHDVNSPR